ncbi:hypothetical protein RND81_13G194500 [Saponaria officinalis]|uniref:FAD-binding domain-containing protein n=1 Tax=Saponaria officinalis TaxID=3572 RepID=A0AAW1H2F0_SAPOF
MESNVDIVIVGAGISGLALALGLHRLGIKSLVLESSDSLRAAGIAFTAWTNAWRALDALGIGESLRQSHGQILGVRTTSIVTGKMTSYVSFTDKGAYGNHEVRCVKRKVLLEALAKELPSETIRYSSKVVAIQEFKSFSKIVHLSNGSLLQTKVLIGCDGVNSVVAKWLGFEKPSLTGRMAIRGCTYYNEGHNFEPIFELLVGNGYRYGVLPCDNSAVFWFITFYPSIQESELLEDADQSKLKQFVLSKLGKGSDEIRTIIEGSEVEEIVRSSIGCRTIWDVLFGNISKDNVCVAGDACHPMPPYLGQGGCTALEDALVLARCLRAAVFKTTLYSMSEDEFRDVTVVLKKFARLRRWRAFDITVTSHVVGFLQECNWVGTRVLRENLFSGWLARFYVKKADFDPRELALEN